MSAPRYARVVVEVEPAHLDRPFDYVIPDDLAPQIQLGSRVEVTFHGRRRRGLVTELADTTEVDPTRLRPLGRVLGPHAWVTSAELDLLTWASGRWAGPLAHVLRHALPSRRVVDVERRATAAGWFPGGGARPDVDLDAGETGAWMAYGPSGSTLVEAVRSAGHGAFSWRPRADEMVADRIRELAASVLAAGRDVLLVTPAPPSQAADAVAALAGTAAVDLRGGPGDRRVYSAWLAARFGQARVVVGERSVAFWPLGQLGLVVVLDEANPALKERRSPRHHVREVALERARREDAVCLLVSRVPSAATVRLVEEGRVMQVAAPRSRERRAAPQVVVAGPDPVAARLPRVATAALRSAVKQGEYAVVLSSQRGEGSALVCRGCGRMATCPRCEAALSRGSGPDPRLFCRRCGYQDRARWRCPACQERELAPLAAGAERLASELRRSMPAPVVTLEGFAAAAPPPPAVLVMTRGSVIDDPPGPVGAVVLPDVDRFAARPSIDAAEDTLRLGMTLGSWVARTVAGRDPDRPVVIMTSRADHHEIRALVGWDVDGFWRAERERRQPLLLPPIGTVIHVDIEDPAVADEVVSALPSGASALGPVALDGMWRLLVTTDDRVGTVWALTAISRDLSARGVAIRADVEPVDLG